MSTSRVSGAGNGGAVQPIPAGSRKVVQSLKEIVNCPEAEIYAALKECNMDPNEAVNRLLSQDPFHEVKSKREKKKEVKDQTESRSRGANSSSNRGSKTGADCQYGRGSSAQYYTSDSSLFGKTTYKKENGSSPYSSLLSSVHGGSGNSKSRGPPGHSDDASAESKGSFQGTADVWPSVSQPAWVGTPGQVSMADIVRMGRPNKKGSNAPNELHHNIQDPFVNESLHKDHASKVNQADVPSVQHVATSDDWPSIEKPAAPSVIPFSEHPDTELHPEASRVSYDNANYEAEEVQEEEDDDNFESSGGNDDGSVSISSRRMIREDVSRGASQFDNELYKNMGTYESEAHDFERHEVDEVGSSVISVSQNLRQLSVNKDDGGFPSEANAPSVVIPEHLQVHTADCSHLTFGSFGSAMNDAYSSGTTSFLEKPNLEEAQNETEESTGGQPETRHSEYYVDDSLRSTPDDSLLHRNSATVGNYDAASSAPQPEELRPESADVAHGNQYPFPSSDSGYSFEDAQRLNAAFNRTSSQMQTPAPFSNVMHAYSNSLPSTLLAANVQPIRESDLQYPFSLTQSLTAKYVNSVFSVGASATSISEDLKTTGLHSTQPNIATRPPLPQHLAAVHPYSQPTLPIGPFANMIGYPFLPQSYTYVPSAFQQSFPGSSNYHQSLAAVLPQYKSSVSASNLPASGYGGFGNNSTIPGNYSSGTSLSYDEVLSSQYKDNSSHLLSLQQKENSAMWLHGNSRTVPAVPGSTYYNYQTQNQQLGGFRQVQQQSQSYGPSGYPNFYQTQARISLDQQQQNTRDLSLGGSQEHPKQSQIWPNNY